MHEDKNDGRLERLIFILGGRGRADTPTAAAPTLQATDDVPGELDLPIHHVVMLLIFYGVSNRWVKCSSCDSDV